MRQSILDLGERLAASENSRGAARAFEKWALCQPWRPLVLKETRMCLDFDWTFPLRPETSDSVPILCWLGQGLVLQLALCLQHQFSISEICCGFKSHWLRIGMMSKDGPKGYSYKCCFLTKSWVHFFVKVKLTAWQVVQKLACAKQILLYGLYDAFVAMRTLPQQNINFSLNCIWGFGRILGARTWNDLVSKPPSS